MSHQICHTPSFAFLPKKDKEKIVTIANAIDDEIAKENPDILVATSSTILRVETTISPDEYEEDILKCLMAYYLDILNWTSLWICHGQINATVALQKRSS